MKVALKKRNEGRKAETKTSDKENESVQRKWLRGAAPPEESPTAWCFLSSQRLRVGGQLTNCTVTSSPRTTDSPEALARKASYRQPGKGAQTENPRLEARLTASCWVPLAPDQTPLGLGFLSIKWD